MVWLMLRPHTILAGLVLLLAANSSAAVRYLATPKIWVLETDRTSYVLGINELNVDPHAVTTALH